MGFQANPNAHREIMEQIGPVWQEEAGFAGKTAIQALMPRQTFFMVTALDSRPFTDDLGDPAVRFADPAEQTYYTDQGTGLYGPLAKVITPKVGKALSWLADGQRHFAKSVKGQPGQRFFLRGLSSVFGADRVHENRWGRER